MLLETTPKSAKTHHPTIRRASQRVATTMWDLAIWTYQRQKAHLDSGAAHNPGYSSLSGTAVVGRACSAGGFFGGGSVSRTYADDDALTVHGLVLRMAGHDRKLIIGTASIGRAPDWSPFIPEFKVVPVKGRRGAHRGIYDRNGNLIGHEIAYVGFAPQRAALAVSHAREGYGAWYGALYALRERLMGSPLQRWVVTGIGAEAIPWAL
jgi:hypothetical protein